MAPSWTIKDKAKDELVNPWNGRTQCSRFFCYLGGGVELPPSAKTSFEVLSMEVSSSSLFVFFFFLFLCSFFISFLSLVCFNNKKKTYAPQLFRVKNRDVFLVKSPLESFPSLNKSPPPLRCFLFPFLMSPPRVYGVDLLSL